MRGGRSPRVALAAVMAAFVAAAPATRPTAAPARGPVPPGWLGVSLNDFALSEQFDVRREAQEMSGTGLQSVRLPVLWSNTEPQPGDFRFAEIDRGVEAAAAQGLSVLVVVTGFTPRWAALRPGVLGSAPRRTTDYIQLLEALIARYGPNGAFWAEHPDVPLRPVREWQVWNEPELPESWSPQPFAHDYVRLLRAARTAIKRQDPGATVVSAGLTNFSWKDLEAMYRAGARGAFDVAAVHPYTYLVRNVFRVVDRVRAVMHRWGDGRKPVLITELSWFSSRRYLGPYELFSVSECDQAARLVQAIRGLAARRARDRIAGVFWYTWLSPRPGSSSVFDYAGLRRLGPRGPVDKPALGAMREVAHELER